MYCGAIKGSARFALKVAGAILASANGLVTSSVAVGCSVFSGAESFLLVSFVFSGTVIFSGSVDSLAESSTVIFSEVTETSYSLSSYNNLGG